jgi:site-specific recombinase XerD
MSILFWLYAQKTNEEGLAPIYCRITLDGNRTQFSTAKRVHPDYWNAAANKVSNKCLNAAAINEDLESIKGDLRKIYNQLTATQTHVTGEMVKNAFTGKGEEKKTIIGLYEYNIELFRQKVKQKKAAYKTLQRFLTIKTKVFAYLREEFNLSDKPLCDIKQSFGEDFKHYLTVHDGLCENTAMKYLKSCKQLFHFAVLKNWLEKNPMQGFKCTYKNPHRETLTMQEIIELQQLDLPLPRLTEVRDVYIFSCYTGYAYQEVYNLSPENIVIGMDGNKWLNVQRQKTKDPEMVPLLPVALQMIEKYQDHPYCIANNKLFPVNSNQKYNEYLKEIAKIAGIKKKMTTHIARHTFATTILLDNDVPIETASKLLGHSSLRTTQIYTKVSLKKISNNMAELRNKLLPSLSVSKSGT